MSDFEKRDLPTDPERLEQYIASFSKRNVRIQTSQQTFVGRLQGNQVLRQDPNYQENHCQVTLDDNTKTYIPYQDIQQFEVNMALEIED
tara:strand:+ start:9533 stop:9799 length:267 start_codon:yes stop_codon:yes gene_type:complete